VGTLPDLRCATFEEDTMADQDHTHEAPTKLNKPDPVWAGLSMGELGQVAAAALLAFGPLSALTAWLPRWPHLALVLGVAGYGVVHVRLLPHGRPLLAWAGSALRYRRVAGSYLWHPRARPAEDGGPGAGWATLVPAVRYGEGEATRETRREGQGR
jgi:hypothetical protein